MVSADDQTYKTIPGLSASEKKTLNEEADNKSLDETKQLSSGRSERDLKRAADENEAARTERFRDHFETLAIWTLYAVWAGFILFGFVWAYHQVSFPGWYRLPQAQLDHIQSLLVGGLVGIATSFAKRRLGT